MKEINSSTPISIVYYCYQVSYLIVWGLAKPQNI